MADDERQAEIEAAARAFLPETPITHPAIGEIGPDAPAAIRYEQRREALAAALDRVRNARGDDEACPDCWGGRPKWAGTMPAPPCPTCDGTGKRSPQGEDHEAKFRFQLPSPSLEDHEAGRRAAIDSLDAVDGRRWAGAGRSEVVDLVLTAYLDRVRDARGDDEGCACGKTSETCLLPPDLCVHAARSPQGEGHEDTGNYDESGGDPF